MAGRALGAWTGVFGGRCRHESDRWGWGGIPGKFFRPLKSQITIRVDKDVLHWLKSGGSGYQSRLNAILREAMIREQKGEMAHQPKAEAISA